jgi:pimeloyl-ACP methyl ester carboxylesterase
MVALGVPMKVQKQLCPEEATQLHAFLESIVQMGARWRGQLLEQHMSEYGAEQIRNIQTPTLVMHARDDTLVPFEQGEFVARNISGAGFIPMGKGGHLALMMNMNAEVREKLLVFLEQNNQ